jgi:prepilin-type N-terminal cleavage/methylation domain-containing protein
MSHDGQGTSRLVADDGFTLIEILVVITILAVALGGLAATFTSSGKLTVKAEAETAATSQAHQEIESVGNLPYNITAPTSTTGSAGWTSTATSLGLPIGTSEVTPNSPGIDRDGTWTSRSGVSGSIYRYVTWVSGTNNKLKKVTVAVTARQLGNPVVLSVFRRDPDAGPGNSVGAGGPCITVGVTCDP